MVESLERQARGPGTAAALNRREIDLAGDVRTMPEAAEILTESLERPIGFAQTPIEQVQQYSKDMALLLQWFERVGYGAAEKEDVTYSEFVTRLVRAHWHARQEGALEWRGAGTDAPSCRNQ